MKSPRLLALEAELAHVKAEIEALARPKKKVRNLMTAKEIEPVKTFVASLDFNDSAFSDTLYQYITEGLLTKEEFKDVIREAMDQSFRNGMECEADGHAMMINEGRM